MNDIMIRVPISRFRREMRKWMRIAQTEDIMITVNGVDTSVIVGVERYNEMVNLKEALESHS